MGVGIWESKSCWSDLFDGRNSRGPGLVQLFAGFRIWRHRRADPMGIVLLCLCC